jgi:hypothetical protein
VRSGAENAAEGALEKTMVSKGLGFRTLLLVALIGVAGCGQSEPTPAQKAAQAQRQQRAEALEEARQQQAEARQQQAEARQKQAEAEAAEARLMADFRVAGPELKRRLAERVRRSGRLLILGPFPGASNFSITAMPLSTPWAVECSSSGLTVTFGGWSSGNVDEGSGEISPDFALSLTVTRPSEELCVEFVSLIGEALVELVSPDR